MKNYEFYNIHDLVSFSLINKTGTGLLPNINPEYKYFQSDKKCSNHFQIVVNNKPYVDDYVLERNDKRWRINLGDYITTQKLSIYPEKLGLLSQLSFLKFKNIYVRSLLSFQIVNNGSSLVHSGAFEINNESFILAGRPGVFKTSILMDAIKYHDANFLGEENCLIHDFKVYPFPLNIDSISYKIKNFANENASGKLQKIKLGLHLLLKSKSIKYSLPIAKPCPIQNICYLAKGSSYKIKEVGFEEILPYLLDNELQELSIPPTHSLSGINYNYFEEKLNEINDELINTFSQKLKKIFKDNLQDARFFLITSPQKYSKNLTENLINFIKNEK